MKNRKRLYLVAGLLLAIMLSAATSYPLYRAMTAPDDPPAASLESSYSQLVALLEGGEVESLTLHDGGRGVATARDGTSHLVTLPQAVAARLAESAAELGAEVSFSAQAAPTAGDDRTGATALAVGGNLALVAGLGALFYVLVLKGRVGPRASAGMAQPVQSAARFADVAGCDAEKHELMEVVEFLRDPERFTRLGGRVPAGVLMSGPPGTGKTLLARAVAGEAGVPFFSASGSDFVEMYVGVGARRVRSIFAKAKKKAPCILFVDEIDAVGRSRSSAGGSAHEEREQTLNQLLVEMDGFKPNCGIIVIAATNRPEILDKALVRPGRFSRHIVLQNPDRGGREKILAVHATAIALHPSIDLSLVARGTPGFSGADLANLVNEAAIMAARADRPAVIMDDFEHAKDRILMGNERRSLVLSEEDRRLTAYHEAGHALVAEHSPASDPIHKVTIVPRGRALGMVVRLPERDSPALRRSKLAADLAVAMGGRAAEELVFGPDDVSTGAAGDIQMATQIARRMVAEWGMSEQVGMICYDLNGPAFSRESSFSEESSRDIDREVRALIAEARDRALSVLVEQREALEILAAALLERESLTGAEVADLLKSCTAPVSLAASA